MPTIADVRAQFPQYSDMSDEALAGALHAKFYSDMPREQFNAKIGLTANPQSDSGSSVLGNAQTIADNLKAGRFRQAFFGEGPLTIGGAKPSIIDAAKNFYQGVKAPGDIANADIAPRTPGILTEEDAFRQNSFADAIRNRGQQMAGSVMTGAIPGGLLGAPRGALGMGMVRPGGISGEAVGAAEAPINQQLIEKANSLGVDIPRYMAGNRFQQGLGTGMSHIPGVGDKIAAAAEAMPRQLGQAAGEVAQGFGTASPAVAGSYAKDALANWIGPESKKIADRIYDAVDQHINPEITTELSATRKAAQTIIDRRAVSKIPGTSKAVDSVMEAASTPGGLTYEGVKGLRSYIGEMTPDEIVSQGFKAGEVKQLYGALTQDLRSATLNAGGPKALTAFNKANDIYQQMSARRDALAKIIGVKGDAAPEAVFSRLVAMAGSKSNADITRLMQARKTIGPEAWNEVASAIVSKLGRDARGEFSIDRFLGPTNGYTALSPGARNLLFKSTGKDSLGKALDDIAFVSSNLQDKIRQFANPSGTARGNATVGIAMDVLHHPVRLLATLTGGRQLEKYLSAPATAQPIAEWSKAYREAIIAPHANSSAAVQRAAAKVAEMTAPSVGMSPTEMMARLVPASVIMPPQPIQ